MHNVTPEQFALLEEIYPGRFQIEYRRDYADYVYEAEKLAKLSGKKYHGKKNHTNKFKKLYPNWQYERLNDSNVEECFQMALKWRNKNGCGEAPETVSYTHLGTYRDSPGYLAVETSGAALTGKRPRKVSSSQKKKKR